MATYDHWTLPGTSTRPSKAFGDAGEVGVPFLMPNCLSEPGWDREFCNMWSQVIMSPPAADVM